MSALFWGLLSGIIFCTGVWLLAFVRSCPVCHGRGFYWQSKVVEEGYSVDMLASCPRKCAP